MIYTVTLNPAIDYVVDLECLEPGKLNRTCRETVQFGGKGINVSNVLRSLGVDSVAMGFTAGFTGEALEKGLRVQGLSTRFISVEQGMTRINVKIKAREETEINGMGPVITPRDLQRLDACLEELEQGDVLVLSGSVPIGLDPGIYGYILARLAGKGILTVVDTAGEALRNALSFEPFLVKPNLPELEDFFGIPLDTEEKILNAAMKMQKLGAKNVLVSLGADGALLRDYGGGVQRCACPQGQVVNTVGAGDSMVAGFLAGYLQSGSFELALKLGVAAGSATAFKIGLAKKEEIVKLFGLM